MQFNVPQFIEVEDKLIGPLTLRQFLYLAAGGGVCFMLYFMLKLSFFIIITVLIMSFCVILAFAKINGRAFPHFLKNFVAYALHPKIYIWKRKEVKMTMAQ